MVLEIWLGILVCLAFSSFLATRAPGGFVNVLGGLMSFALCSLLFAPLAVVKLAFYFIEDESPDAARQIPLTLKYLEQVSF